MNKCFPVWKQTPTVDSPAPDGRLPVQRSPLDPRCLRSKYIQKLNRFRNNTSVCVLTSELEQKTNNFEDPVTKGVPEERPFLNCACFKRVYFHHNTLTNMIMSDYGAMGILEWQVTTISAHLRV